MGRSLMLSSSGQKKMVRKSVLFGGYYLRIDRVGEPDVIIFDSRSGRTCRLLNLAISNSQEKREIITIILRARVGYEMVDSQAG